MTNNDVQNTIQKTNERATRIPLKIEDEFRCQNYITPAIFHYQ